ncbi:serine/threonine-protein phosphatase [Nocardioides sp. ChNu-153]|uniref:PP2C family protein-serine/threonine phosphatase n=1 Tax=unclassified Nocardioides TaxID=2615069 RepID=UPI0024060FAE|nr:MULTISPECIES: PP2C family protein-serine/threonine phosphatase [unclassified Nocardioides]MDF9716339.1 serine/threonine-protein phosphatase [Nocardioides sp. ChNu-99]MDN7122845.1 serine/threonine-protein phosphatase [Nocardioides sp. ChNu-153]
MRRSAVAHRALGALVVTTTVVGCLVALWPDTVPLNTLTVPMVASTLFLRPRQLAGYIVFAMVVLGLALTQQTAFTPKLWASVAVYTTIGLLVLVTSLRRVRLGLGGAEGEAMLVDLRDRIQAQGRLPELPEGWAADRVVRTADGTAFSGDFFCFSETACGGRLDAVLVDVSGKGVKAGTRALQLSSALNGLVAAVPPAELVPAANEFLLRQGWNEGFATAVHLSVDLRSGDVEAYTAGHPPALVIRRCGEVQRVELSGPLLGVVPGADYPPARLRLDVGDAVVLYTDGLVEDGGTDIDDGIALLSEHLLRHAPAGLAGLGHRVLADLGPGADDCALLVLRRT